MKKPIGCFLPEFPTDGNSHRSKELNTKLADALSVTAHEIEQGVVIADARDSDLRLVYANRAFEALTGYATSYAVGRNCRYLQRGERDQPDIRKIRQAIAAREPVSATIRNYRKDGTPFWNCLRLLPVFSEARELTHYVGLMREVSVAASLSDSNGSERHIDPLTGLRDRYDLVCHLDKLTAGGRRSRSQACPQLLCIAYSSVALCGQRCNVERRLTYRAHREILVRLLAGTITRICCVSRGYTLARTSRA